MHIIKKYIAFISIFILFGASYIPTLGDLGYRNTTYVDDDYTPSTIGWGYDHFDNIQDGIDAVDENGAVFVYNGTYFDTLKINKTINLVGENKSSTFIVGKHDYIMEITANFVNLTGFTFQSNWTDDEDVFGILIKSDNNFFSNNILDPDSLGFYLSYATNNTIYNNLLIGVGVDINILSNYNKIINNSIINSEIDGIMIDHADYNTIKGNKISSNNNNGIYLDRSCFNTIIDNNISYNSNCGINMGKYCLNNTVSENIIMGNIKHGFILWKSYHNNIFHNNFLNNDVIELEFGSGFINFWDNGYPKGGNYWYNYSSLDINADGIGDVPYNVTGWINQDRYPLMHPYGSIINLDTDEVFLTIQDSIDDSDTNTGDTIFVKNGIYNEIVNIYKSISLIGENSEKTIIDGNSINYVISVHTQNVEIKGFTIVNSSSGSMGIWGNSILTINISDCIIKNKGEAGIGICICEVLKIKNCKIYDNFQGIQLDEVDNTIIKNCSIYNNEYGIDIWDSYDFIIENNIIQDNQKDGIIIRSSNSGKIFHNNLINNTPNGYDDSVNTWYFNFSGNYWIDYSGIDSDMDGIGDTPYDIPGGSNKDLYPLIKPWNGSPPIPSNISKMEIIPSKETILLGEEFNITIYIDPVEEIGGWQIYQLNFTQTCGNATMITPGSYWSSNFDAGTIDNNFGTIKNIQTWTTGPYPDSNHTACTISFIVKHPGKCIFKLDKVKITDSNFEDIDFFTHDASINIISKPTISNKFPLNGTIGFTDCGIDALRPPSQININVEDLDGDKLDIYVKWLNHSGKWSIIDAFYNVSGGIFFVNDSFVGDDWVWGNTTYIWSVNVTDGVFWVNKSYNFRTGGSRYDVNNDCEVNFQDAGKVWIHRTSISDYDSLYDVNQNGDVNFQDAGLTWINRD